MLELFTQDQIKTVNALVALYQDNLDSFDAKSTSFIEDIDIHETWILDTLHYVDGNFKYLFTIFDGKVTAIKNIHDAKLLTFVKENKATFAYEEDAEEFLEFLETMEMFGDFI